MFFESFNEYKEKDLAPQINGVSDPMAKEFHIVEAFCKMTWDAAEEKNKWHTWKEQLPPFDTKLLWYSEKYDQYGIGTWSYPECSNHKQVINNLKSGEWKEYGCCIGYATHWKYLEKPTI